MAGLSYFYNANPCNMYDSALLLRNFSTLVGLFQPNDPAYNRLPAYLNASTSGRYVQTTHPLCTIENLYNSAPAFDKFNYQAWEAIEYPVNFIVSSSGKLYITTRDIDSTEPQPTDATADGFGEDTGKAWRKIDPFSAWLDRVKGAAIIELFADFGKIRKLDHAARSLLESQILFNGIGYKGDYITPMGRFVGFEITVSQQEGIAAIVGRIGLQLDGMADLTVYLYHSSAHDPVAEFDLTLNRPHTFAWQDIAGAILSHSSNLRDAGGTYYLGYYESDLGTVQAINRQYDFSRGVCATCNDNDYRAFTSWSKYISVRPFSVDASNLNDERTLWDVRKVSYSTTTGTNWGMNIALTVSCDLTDVFSTNKAIFADALAKKICLKFLAEIAYSTRMNAIPEQIKGLAMADLLPNEKSNFQAEYRQEIEALQVDFSGMNSACMPCMGNRRKITLGAV